MGIAAHPADDTAGIGNEPRAADGRNGAIGRKHEMTIITHPFFSAQKRLHGGGLRPCSLAEEETRFKSEAAAADRGWSTSANGFSGDLLRVNHWRFHHIDAPLGNSDDALKPDAGRFDAEGRVVGKPGAVSEISKSIISGSGFQLGRPPSIAGRLHGQPIAFPAREISDDPDEIHVGAKKAKLDFAFCCYACHADLAL